MLALLMAMKLRFCFIDEVSSLLAALKRLKEEKSQQPALMVIDNAQLVWQQPDLCAALSAFAGKSRIVSVTPNLLRCNDDDGMKLMDWQLVRILENTFPTTKGVNPISRKKKEITPL